MKPMKTDVVCSLNSYGEFARNLLTVGTKSSFSHVFWQPKENCAFWLDGGKTIIRVAKRNAINMKKATVKKDLQWLNIHMQHTKKFLP